MSTWHNAASLVWYDNRAFLMGAVERVNVGSWDIFVASQERWDLVSCASRLLHWGQLVMQEVDQIQARCASVGYLSASGVWL